MTVYSPDTCRAIGVISMDLQSHDICGLPMGHKGRHECEGKRWIDRDPPRVAPGPYSSSADSMLAVMAKYPPFRDV